jgi:hypothetical protein
MAQSSDSPRDRDEQCPSRSARFKSADRIPINYLTGRFATLPFDSPLRNSDTHVTKRFCNALCFGNVAKCLSIVSYWLEKKKRTICNCVSSLLYNTTFALDHHYKLTVIQLCYSNSLKPQTTEIRKFMTSQSNPFQLDC